MARPVQLRAHYRDDAAFLLRLETAIAKDGRQDSEWRETTCDMIRKVAQRLLEAKQDDLPAINGSGKSTKKVERR